MRYALYIALAATMASVPALADWPQGGIPAGAAPGNDIGTTVVPDGYGGAIYVWLEVGPPSSIKARRINRKGNDVWMMGTVTVTPAGADPAIPSAVADGHGGVLVAWQDKSVSPYQVKIQWVGADGNYLWDMNGVSMWGYPVSLEQSAPVLARSPNRIFVVYQQKNPVPPNTIDLYVQCFDTTGARIWGDYGAVVCTTVVGDNKNPAAIARGDTSIIVAWEDYRSGAGDIYASTVVNMNSYMVNGAAVCTQAGNQMEPSVVRDDSGGAVIAWQDYRNGNSDIYAQRYTWNGMMAWLPAGGVPVCTLAGDQHELAVTKAAQGKSLLVWSDLRYGTGQDDIYGMMLNNDGSQHWPEAGGRMICDALNEQRAPDVLAHASGNQFLITWQDRRSGDWDVYALKMDDLAGQVGWQGWVRQQAGNNSQNPKVCWGSPDYIFCAWIDDRNAMGWDVYGQRGRWDCEYFGSVCAPELAGPANMGTVGSEQVTFSWHPSPYPPGAQSYQLHVEDVSNPAVFFNAGPTDTSVQLTIPAGHSYLWQVRGIFNLPSDTSDWCDPWSFTVDTSVPPTPALYGPPDNWFANNDWIDFSWEDVGAAYYNIQVSNDQAFSAITVDDTTGAMASYGNNFTEGAHWWRVRAGSGAYSWSGWSASRRFVIDMTLPTVDSIRPVHNGNNIALDLPVRVYYSEPMRADTSLHFSCSPDPGGWSVSPQGNVLVFNHNPFSYQTHYTFSATASDSGWNPVSTGGIEFTTVNLVDTVPPRLMVLANNVDMVLGQQFTFECYAKDEHKLNRVHLTYGPAGSGTTSGDVDLYLVPGTDSLWRYTIPANHVSTRGVQYQVWAQDSILAGGLNNVTYFPPNPTDFYVHAVSFPGGAYSTTFAQDQWLMLSVPGDYSSISLFDMLEDDLGGYDKTRWRLFDYQNTTLVEQSTGGSGVIRTGQALWLRQRVGASISLDFQDVHKSYGDRLRSNPAQVPLVPGWSDVGNPLAFDVRWDTTLAISDTASVAGPYHFNGSSWLLPNQVASTTVAPYAGYTFRNNRASNAMLRIPMVSAWKGKDDGKTVWPEGWQVRVTARSGEKHDSAWLGIGAGTSAGLDRWDFPEPPNGLVPVAGYFQVDSERCATDLRPELGQGQTWEYGLTSGGPVTLDFGLSPGIPSDVGIWLLDPVRQSSFPITDGFAYQYTPEPGETVRRFRLVAGGEDYIRAALAGAFGTPTTTLMERSRPNPFNQIATINYQISSGGPVRIAVYNVTGQLVRTLVDRVQMAGRYSVRWDGRDERGRAAANGVYLVRMTAGGASSCQRLTLVR